MRESFQIPLFALTEILTVIFNALNQKFLLTKYLITL